LTAFVIGQVVACDVEPRRTRARETIDCVLEARLGRVVLVLPERWRAHDDAFVDVAWTDDGSESGSRTLAPSRPGVPVGNYTWSAGEVPLGEFMSRPHAFRITLERTIDDPSTADLPRRERRREVVEGPHRVSVTVVQDAVTRVVVP